MAKKDAVENLGPFGTLESVLTEKCRIMSTACNRECYEERLRNFEHYNSPKGNEDLSDIDMTVGTRDL
ncbi:hypothetical protein KFU94_53775 [Chloroflexi bacterium TSY]|nr:hypothetical protein [Chloroflexi bacterium TSY]